MGEGAMPIDGGGSRGGCGLTIKSSSMNNNKKLNPSQSLPSLRYCRDLFWRQWQSRQRTIHRCVSQRTWATSCWEWRRAFIEPWRRLRRGCRSHGSRVQRSHLNRMAHRLGWDRRRLRVAHLAWVSFPCFGNIDEKGEIKDRWRRVEWKGASGESRVDETAAIRYDMRAEREISRWSHLSLFSFFLLWFSKRKKQDAKYIQVLPCRSVECTNERWWDAREKEKKWQSLVAQQSWRGVRKPNLSIVVSSPSLVSSSPSDSRALVSQSNMNNATAIMELWWKILQTQQQKHFPSPPWISICSL